MSDPTTPVTPTAAGMYDYHLGGSSHSPVDRAAAERIAQLIPEIGDAAWANRGFLQRAVKQMASQWGIGQFLDIGSGLPTQRNTHDVVAEVNPHGRVVYVDIDPAVVERAQDILGGAEGATVIQGDVRQPDAIFDHPQVRRLIDLSAPVGLLLVAVLHFVPDDDDPWALVAHYRDRLVAGSCLALSHSSFGDQVSDDVRQAGSQLTAGMATPPTDRSKTEIERFFQGMEIVPAYAGAAPGIVHVGLWGADDPEYADSEGSRLGFAGVARIT